MIEIVDGIGVGSGKSFYVMTRCLAHFLRGGTVYSSDSFHLYWDKIKAGVKEEHGLLLEDSQYKQVPSSEITRLHESTPAGTDDCPVLIVVDEAQDHFDVREYADKSKKAFFSWCTQSRHDNNDLIFISQDAKNIDSRFRRLATYRITVRNSKTWKSAALGDLCSLIRLFTLGINNGYYFVPHFYDRDGKTLVERKWIKPNPRLFGYYESKSRKLVHKRAGLIDSVKLQKVEKKKEGVFMFRWVILIFGVAGIVCAVMLYKSLSSWGVVSGGEQSAAVALVGSTVAAVVPKAEKTGSEWSVLTEEFRGVSEGGGIAVLRTDKGQYQKGAMSQHGYVLGVDVSGRVALVRGADGRDLYVVAADQSAGRLVVSEKADAGRTVEGERGRDPRPSDKPSSPAWMGQEALALGLGDGRELDWMQYRIKYQPVPRK